MSQCILLMSPLTEKYQNIVWADDKTCGISQNSML